jgi:hypothetical protein
VNVDPAVELGTRQLRARALNERMWQVNIAFWEATGVFLVACECADEACEQSIEIAPREYEELRRKPQTFVVHREHAEHPIADDARYAVVQPAEQTATESTGGRTALELSSAHFRALVTQLLDVLPAQEREQALSRAGRRFGRQLGSRARLVPERDVARGLEEICRAVRSLGFDASLDTVEGDTAVIRTPACPLRPLVSERLEAAAIDRGMWLGLLDQGLDDVSASGLSCETSQCLERGEPCTVTLRLSRT